MIKKLGIGCGGLVALLVVLSVLASGSRTSPGTGTGVLSGGVPNPTSTSAPATATAAPTARVTFTNANWALAVGDANAYKGSPVTLLGRIFLDPERTAEQVAFQMYADPANSGQNTGVGGLPPDTAVKKNDYVKVVGEIFDLYEGTNAFGAKIRIPRIRATSVTKATRAEVIAPTVTAVAVDAPIRQHAITITLQKVEFAKTETRLFVRIENAGPAKANVYTFNLAIVQGAKQLKTKSVYDSGYPDLPSGMLAGVSAETVLLFDPLDVAPFRFVWEASSDNYSQRFQPYTWTVTP